MFHAKVYAINQHYFHARCVGLSYDEGCSCLHQNIFWMCDTCRDEIKRDRFWKAFNEKHDNNRDRNYATMSEIDCLRSEIERIREDVAKIESNSGVVLNQLATTSYGQQCGFNDGHSSCSPLSSTKLNAVDTMEQITNNAHLQLYVSNIAPDVSERELKEMICDSIGAADVLHVKCLVPSWQNVSLLRYVSYKVTVDAQFRKSAFKISNWPNGVRCREFLDISNAAWRPSSRID